MSNRARNLTTIALTCVMAVLLCLAQTASALAAKSPGKTASGIFFGESNIYTGEILPESLQPQWEIAPATTATASGRQVWLSADPIGEIGGLNLYGYVGNNPLNSWDPLGLDKDSGCPLTKPDAFDKKLGAGDFTDAQLKNQLGQYRDSLRWGAEKGKWRHVARMNHRINRIVKALSSRGIALATIGGLLAINYDAEAAQMLGNSLSNIQISVDCGENPDSDDISNAQISSSVLYGAAAGAVLEQNLKELIK